MFLFQAAIAGSHARWLDRAKERNTKKKSHKHKKPSPLHSIVRSEIERLFIKILYVLDDNRRSQLVWKDETQVDLRSENLQLPSLTNFSRCLTNLDTKRKQIWAPMRPLLVTKLWTGCSGQFFFPPTNHQKMPKNRFAGGKKIGRVWNWALKKKLHLWDSSCGSNGPQSHKKCLIWLLHEIFEIFLQGKIDKWSDWSVLNLT